MVEAFELAVGNTWGQLRTINHGALACTLDGYPALTIDQNGHQLHVSVDHASPHLQPADGPAEIRLEPKASAWAALFWRGYRTAADQTSAQEVHVVLADGATDVAALGTYVRGAPPFDLIDGGSMTVDRWVSVGYGAPHTTG